MRIAFMGTPDFACPTLERLVESEHEVALVVTQPDRRGGRGRKTLPPPVKSLALGHGLQVIQPESLRDDAVAESLAPLALDAIVVVAYGQILPQAILDTPRLGCINIHASLLPHYRGAAPINWAIVNGEAETGVTIMQMAAGMDTGPIIRQERVPILEDDDAVSLANMLSVIGAELLMGCLAETEQTGCIESEEQDESMVSFAPILKKSDGRINWERSTEELVCFVRGLTPWPAAQAVAKRGGVKILAAEPLWPDACSQIESPAQMAPGTVALALKGHGFAVRTLDGFLLVRQGQIEGTRAMSGVDLLNGKLITVGEQLKAPTD